MMTDDQLHLQVKTIETELSRAQSCLANGDVHASQLHQLFAMSAFLSTMGAIHNVPIGAFGRSGARIYGNIDTTDADGQNKVRFSASAFKTDAAPVAQPVPAMSRPRQEPQEPYWKESSYQPDFWILQVGNHQIGAVSMQSDDKWFIDGIKHGKPYDFDGARVAVEQMNGLRPCRVWRA